MKYSPDITSQPKDIEELWAWAAQEFENIFYAFQVLETKGITLEVLYAEPTKPTDGQIVIADGTTWNPGATGRGVYEYRTGTGWVKL